MPTLLESGLVGPNQSGSFIRRDGQVYSRSKTGEELRLTQSVPEGVPSRTGRKSAVLPHLDHWQRQD